MTGAYANLTGDQLHAKALHAWETQADAWKPVEYFEAVRRHLGSAQAVRGHVDGQLTLSGLMPDCWVVVEGGHIVGTHDEPCRLNGVEAIRYVPAAPSHAFCDAVDAELAATAVEDAATPAIPSSKFEPCMDIYSRPGTQVRFRARGGYDWEKEAALKAGFVLDQTYTVKRSYVGHSSTKVLFDEIPGEWNSCLFADVAAEQPAARALLTVAEIERIYDRYGGDMMNCARAIERAARAIKPTDADLAPALPAFAQELAAFGALLDPDSLEQAS